ncbi:unnamed protein product, partial [Rotaria sp. Silwood2]
SVIGLLSLWIFVEWRQRQEKKFKSDSMISTTKCSEPLHWNPFEEQRGFGDLIIKVNHIAITVSDVGRSIIGHIAFEILHTNKVINKLRQLNMDVRQSLLISDTEKSKAKIKLRIIQYFFNDLDEYYLELCNCHIPTEFSLNKDKTIDNIDYYEGISNKRMLTVVQAVSHWKQKIKNILVNNLMIC